MTWARTPPQSVQNGGGAEAGRTSTLLFIKRAHLLSERPHLVYAGSAVARAFFQERNRRVLLGDRLAQAVIYGSQRCHALGEGPCLGSGVVPIPNRSSQLLPMLLPATQSQSQFTSDVL